MGLRIRRLLSQNRIFQMILFTAAAVLCLMVWPLRTFYHETVSSGKPAELRYTGPVTMEEIVLQQFVPAKEHLSQIRIGCQVEDVHAEDRVFVTIYNAEYDIVYQEVPYFSEIAALGEIVVTPELSVIPGDIYYVGLNVHYESVGTLRAAYADAAQLGIEECGELEYAMTPCEGMQLEISFRYTRPYSGGLIVCCLLGIVLGAFAFYIAAALGKEALQKRGLWGRVRKALLLVFFCALEFAVFAAAWMMCVVRVFGGGAPDIAVYAAASLLAACLVGYACLRTVSGGKTHAGVRKSGGKAHAAAQASGGKARAGVRKSGGKAHSAAQASGGKTRAAFAWRDYLQSVCFALLIWAGIRYVDADVQWKQDLARNWVFLAFGLSILFTMRIRSVFHGFTLLWGLVLIPGGMLYVHLKGTQEHGAAAAGCLMAAVFVWGIVVIHLLRTVRRQAGQRFCIPLALCWAAMCVLMLCNRHGKQWPVFMAVVFTVFYLIPYTEAQKRRLTENFMRGVVGHFLWMWVMCLLHRPYHRYRFFRYPMYFHTVASTGMYLVLVEAVALILLFFKIKKTGRVWRGAWKEWLLNAVVVSYIVFSMARTAYLAFIGMCLILIIAAAIVYRPPVKKYAAVAGVFASCTLAALPVVYTLTRCVPAVVNDPVQLNDPERFDEAVRKGEKPDSRRYMDVERLMQIWLERFGISGEEPDGGTDTVWLGTAACADGAPVCGGRSAGAAADTPSGAAEEVSPAAGVPTEAHREPAAEVVSPAAGVPAEAHREPAAEVVLPAAGVPAEADREPAAEEVSPAVGVPAEAHRGLTAENVPLAAEPASQESEPFDGMSNGRIGIFKEYWKRLNLGGHAQMGIEKADGMDSGHAHNSFLQNAYDFGIPAGLLFVGLVFGMIGRSVYLIWTGRDRSRMQFAVLMLLSGFTLVSLTEYSSNPCMPLGFSLFFSLFTMRREKNVVK